MNRLAAALLLAGCVALPAFAQERPERDPLRSISRRLRTELALDSDQSKAYERLLKEHRQEHERRDEAALHRVMTEAHQAGRKGGDLETHRERLRDLTMPMTLTFLDRITPILNDKQRGQLEQIRKRYDPATTMMMGGVLERLAVARTDLELNPQQRTEFDQRVLTAAENLVPGVKTRDLSPAQLDEVLKALQEAMESGDEEAVRNVRGRVIAEQQNRSDVLLDLVLSLNSDLSDAQRPKLEKTVADLFDPRVYEADGTSPQLIARAARRCKLTAEQQGRLKEIEQTIKPAEMRKDPAQRARTVYSVRTSIEELLSAEQLTQYRKALGGRPDRGSGEKKAKAPDKEAKPASEAPEPTEP